MIGSTERLPSTSRSPRIHRRGSVHLRVRRLPEGLGWGAEWGEYTWRLAARWDADWEEK